ncbi:hypothetical protein ACFLXQ_04250 [Chloroflexota bacterium]
MAEAIYKQETFSIGWAFWLQWTLATVFGGLPIIMVNLGGLGSAATIGAGIIVGATTGIMQWLVLRQWFYQVGWWILATAIGGVVALVIALIGVMAGSLFQFVGLGVGGFIMTGAMAGVMSGTVIGTMQWLVLRRFVYWAGWWILIRAVLGSIIVVGKLVFVMSGMGVSLSLGEIITGVVSGAVTGVTLVCLLRYPRQ